QAYQTATFNGTIVSGGAAIGRVSADVRIVEGVGAQAKHVLEDGKDVLRVTVNHRLSRSQDLERIEWAIDAQAGEQQVGLAILAHGDLAVDVALPPLTPAETFAYELKLHFADGVQHTLAGKVRLLEEAAMFAIEGATVDVDGTPDDLTGFPSFDLP